MRVAGMTDIGQQRTQNQDLFDYAEFESGLCWAVVCDGMGGALGGECASRIAVDTVMEIMQRRLSKGTPGDGEIRKVIGKAIESANKNVYEAATADFERLFGMGTTMVIAAINGRVLHVSNVGDSRIYSYVNGVLTQLTKDHSLVQNMVESGELTSDQAAVHPDRNIITRAVGILDNVDYDYRCLVMQPGETVLLCTDGLCNYVSDGRIADIMSKSRFENVPSRLIGAANDGGGGDNITVVVMKAED